MYVSYVCVLVRSIRVIERERVRSVIKHSAYSEFLLWRGTVLELYTRYFASKSNFDLRYNKNLPSSNIIGKLRSGDPSIVTEREPCIKSVTQQVIMFFSLSNSLSYWSFCISSLSFLL
jgi:hypothetical protein